MELPETFVEGEQEANTTSFDSYFDHEAHTLCNNCLSSLFATYHWNFQNVKEKSRKKEKIFSKKENKKEKDWKCKNCRKTCLTRSADHGVGWSEWGGLPGSTRRTRGGWRQWTRTSGPVSNPNGINTFVVSKHCKILYNTVCVTNLFV